MFSDWSFESPETIIRKLKKQGRYYNYQKRTSADFISDVKENGLGATIKERASWSKKRMDPTDFADVTGHTYTYLMNGLPPSLFVSNKGQVSARFTGTYDLLLAQRLILQPRLETNVALQRAEEIGVGGGWNDVELGARIRYEVRREFAPYLGVTRKESFGATHRLTLQGGGNLSHFVVVAVCGRGSKADFRSIVEDETEKGVVDLEVVAAVVLDEAKLPELIHEEVHPRSGGADHFGEGFLR